MCLPRNCDLLMLFVGCLGALRRSVYGAHSLDGWGLDTYQDLYLRMLRPYGHLLGAWAGDLNPLGSCLLVYLDAPKIVGAVVSCLRFREAGERRGNEEEHRTTGLPVCEQAHILEEALGKSMDFSWLH